MSMGEVTLINGGRFNSRFYFLYVDVFSIFYLGLHWTLGSYIGAVGTLGRSRSIIIS